MNITINGEVKKTTNDITLLSLLDVFFKKDSLFAVAINTKFIPKNSYNSTIIKENDAIEILSPMNGG
jgi:sulfur carrier protein